MDGRVSSVLFVSAQSHSLLKRNVLCILSGNVMVPLKKFNALKLYFPSSHGEAAGR